MSICVYLCLGSSVVHEAFSFMYVCVCVHVCLCVCWNPGVFPSCNEWLPDPPVSQSPRPSAFRPQRNNHRSTHTRWRTHARQTQTRHTPKTHTYVLDLVHEHSIQTHPHTHSFSEQISTHPRKHAWRFWQRFTMVPILCWNTEIPHRLMLFLKRYLGCSYTGLCAIIFKQLHCNHCNSEFMIKPNNIFTQ